MEAQKNCSLPDHKDINAILYCPECKIYMCTKCENYHSCLFKNAHHQYSLSTIGNDSSDYCKEPNHSAMKLQYYCKTHNQLCCLFCIKKSNLEGDGKHENCIISNTMFIQKEKKDILIENIKYLEYIEKDILELIKGIKDIFIKLQEGKENAKIEIQKIFTIIRNTLNEREDKLLLEIDELYKKEYFNEDIINKGEQLPQKVKESLDIAKSINLKWDENKLNEYLNTCINIENNVKDIYYTYENIKNVKSKEIINIKFTPRDDSLNKFLEKIRAFGDVFFYGYSFKECPNDINENQKYIVTGKYKNILTKTGKDKWCGAICEKELNISTEIYKWKIKILASSSKFKNIMVGIAPSDFDFYSSNYDNCGWYYYCGNSSLFSGPPHNYNDKDVGLSLVKEEIIIVMDMERRTLKFIIDNKDRGDSIKNIPIDKPLFPAVWLRNKNDSVEISEI